MAENNIKTTTVEFLDEVGLKLYDSLIKAKITSDIKASEYDDSALTAKVTANENDIALLEKKVENLESVTYTPITEAQINALFED